MAVQDREEKEHGAWVVSLARGFVGHRGNHPSAQGTGTSPRLYSINGAVKAVSASSLALEVGDHEIVVLRTDSSTRVVGKGAGASDLLYRYGRRKLTDVIKAGDRVAVACRRSGRALTAVEVRVVTR